MANSTISLGNLHVIVFDVDGVFTDGKTWQAAGGEWRRAFSVRDTMGVRALRKAGYRVVILTSAHSAEIKAHFDRVGVDVFKDHCLEPDAAIEQILRAYGVSKEHAAFVSEDGAGRVALSHAGLKRYISARQGGDGAVLEISNLILQYSHQHASAPQARTGEL